METEGKREGWREKEGEREGERGREGERQGEMKVCLHTPKLMWYVGIVSHSLVRTSNGPLYTC